MVNVTTYKNFEDLEESLSLPELERLLEQIRIDKHEDRKFAAALKGIDIDEGQKSASQEAFDRVKARAEEKLGLKEKREQEEWDHFGLDIEVEE